MKSNKGFTLVELLAVIAILAILVLIALPNIMEMFKEAKKNSFLTECKQIYKTAQNQWMSDSMFDTNEQIYSRCDSCSGKSLKLSGRTQINYYVKVNKAGKISELYVTDNTFQYKYNGGNLLITDITEAEEISNISDDEILAISSSGISVGSPKICKRATVLHEETCANGSYYNDNPQNSRNTYCSGEGYTLNGTKGTTTIVYGNLGTKGVLNSGDAFDCDVNGDGVYDSQTERFYYVSPKDADSSSNYATLIYYNNVDGVSPNNTETVKYGDIMYGGPNIAYLSLPTVDQWKNVHLSNSVRQIKNAYNGTTVERDETTYNLQTFDYGNKAARFLTFAEVKYACGSNNTNIFGYLMNCSYLMEKTDFATANYNGYYLETWSTSAQYVYYGQFVWRKFSANTYSSNTSGVRPAIEVPLEDIEL